MSWQAQLLMLTLTLASPKIKASMWSKANLTAGISELLLESKPESEKKDMILRTKPKLAWTLERGACNPKSKPLRQRSRRWCRWWAGRQSGQSSPRTCTFPGAPREKQGKVSAMRPCCGLVMLWTVGMNKCSLHWYLTTLNKEAQTLLKESQRIYFILFIFYLAKTSFFM